MTPKRLISREEVLGGLPAKQASALVFAIERRTAYLADQARYVMASYLTESVIEARNQAFLLAFAQGAKLPVQPSIQEVERFAPDWATLVPDNASLRAAVARQLGQKYALVYGSVPKLRTALGLDQAAVGQEYRRLYAAPLRSLYAGLIIYYLGLGITLADTTGVPAGVWVGGLFLLGLYFVWRNSLSATVASALVIGGINIILIVVMSGLALTRMEPGNLGYVNLPWLNGRPFEVSILEPILGVVLLAYFGHTSTAGCARVVLRRDSSARSLIRGCMAATVAAMLLYGVWVVVVTSAIPPPQLARETGTVLGPLAQTVGSSVLLFGTLFAVLSMGLTSIYVSLGLFYQLQELLPLSRGPFQLVLTFDAQPQREAVDGAFSAHSVG